MKVLKRRSRRKTMMDLDEFGKIIRIEAHVSIQMDTILTDAAYALLSNNPIRTVQFPEECTITVVYQRHEQTWSCFNVKKEDIPGCVDGWQDSEIVIKEKTDIWHKMVNGYKFQICSYRYTTEENVDER
jgi:hypothetical protein